MPETHPFGNFVPPQPRYLFLGSFPPRSANWFYGSSRNQFWPILEKVYGIRLPDQKSRQDLCSRLKIAVSDIIYQCVRAKGNSLDTNLVDIVYNTAGIEKILRENNIQSIFFTSRFVETRFHAHFHALYTNYPQLKLIPLPSPSPRYALMSKSQKIIKYKGLLPKLNG
jgi:hypoxanthine-DNA glycosylase